MELLNWISANGGEAFMFGLFLLAVLVILSAATIRLVRSYPPASDTDEAPMDQGGFCACECHECSCNCESGLIRTAQRLTAALSSAK